MITVKEIQEKEFSTIETTGGYNLDEVDDFLDELASQMNAMAHEIEGLKARVNTLQASLVAAEEAKKAAEAKIPDFDADAYMQNVQASMRDSLAGAQRIADDTVSRANAKAEKILSDANMNAESITAVANKKVEELNAEAARLRAAASSYSENFRKLVEAQLATLEESKGLLG